MGETYEFKTKKWKFIGEQVSHHPPISAGYVGATRYELWMNTHLKSSFGGKSMEFTPLGYMNFRFKDNDHIFRCKRPQTSVQNILIGTMYIDHKGECIVENTSTGESAVVKFKPLGMFTGKDKRGMVEGSVKDADGNEVYQIYGKWCDELFYKATGEDDSEGESIWKFPPIPHDWEKIYHFTEFTLQLNMIDDHLEKQLPPTDSRLRPDQRCLENGELNFANDEKHRLEEKQRARLRAMKEEGIEYEAKYFEKEDTNTEEFSEDGGKLISYKYKGGYWEDRKEKNWGDAPDLFGHDD